MNRIIKNNKYLIVFITYLLGTTTLFLGKYSLGYNWFEQWFFDKFFIFQFISVVIVGLALEEKYYNTLSYIRIGDRKRILKSQFLRYYEQGFIYLNIMFILIILGGILTNFFLGSKDLLYIVQWYIRYLLGTILLINVILCLSWSNSLILSRYSELLAYAFLCIEVIFIRGNLRKNFNIDIKLLFSWIFYGGLESYFIMLVLIIITTMVCIKLSNRRDFL